MRNFLQKKTAKFFWKTLQQNKEIVLIILCASLLRTWQLSTHLIFFGDAARDLLVAAQSVQTHTLPLLGIPSSVPRFHQGPLAIWIEMLTFLFAGRNVLAYGAVFAFISVLAVIFLYELLVLYANKRVAILASFFLAFSPLAIAQARMPYHINPIPLALIIYFFMLMRLWTKKKRSLLTAILGFCLLFQFELATTPLLLLIPYVVWRAYGNNENGWKLPSKSAFQKLLWKQIGKEIIFGILIGILPQILYDLTHHFEHLGGFVIWVIYRCVSFLGYKQAHAFSPQHFFGTFQFFQIYVVRIWSVDNLWIAVPMIFLYALSKFWCLAALFYKKFQQKFPLPPIIEICFVATAIQTLAYFVHGSPSEAYFPPFFIFSAVLVGYFLAEISKISQKTHVYIYVLLAIFATANTVNIFQANFFVSNHQPFSYGYSLAEQKEIVNETLALGNTHVQYRTSLEDGKFPTYFDNLRWLLQEKGFQEDGNTGQIFYVEPKGKSTRNFYGYAHFSFPTTDVYEDIGVGKP